MVDPAVLAALTPFQGAPATVLAVLGAHAFETRHAPDEVMFLAGSAPRGWYVVVEGRVRVVRGSGPRQHVIHTETRGGTLGEVPLFAGGTHPATGIAAEPTTCALFSMPALRAAMADDDTVAMILLRRLALRTRTLVERLDERSSQSVRSRLIEFLLTRASTSARGVFSLGMTQQQLAEELGTAREVVSRELRSLCGSGFLEGIGSGRYSLRS